MTLPTGFAEMLKECGHAPFGNLADTLATTPPDVAVRLNRAKPARTLSGIPVPWNPDGLLAPELQERPLFTADPLIHQGGYYVQDAASMIIGEVARQIAGGTPLRWLDACAAPGGKTTAAAAALPQGSLVVANEFVPARAAILRENIAKWGSPDIAAVCGDTALLGRHEGLFDVIAADVPCSGEGMMRKDPEAVAQWSPALISSCVARQRQIVTNLWPALRPGGCLVYSTCTFNPDENERMIEWIMSTFGATPVEIAVSPGWGITGAIGGAIPAMRFIPGLTKGEGLFMAVVRKPDGDRPSPRRRDKDRRPAKGSGREGTRALADATGWSCAATELRLEGDSIVAVNTGALAPGMPPSLVPSTVIARVKGRDVIPTQELALSTLLRPDAFSSCEVDRQTALAYLHSEAVILPGSAPRGFVLLRHGGLPLGFVKNLGNRSNNLYPREWRVKTAYTGPALPPLPFT